MSNYLSKTVMMRTALCFSWHNTLCSCVVCAYNSTNTSLNTALKTNVPSLHLPFCCCCFFGMSLIPRIISRLSEGPNPPQLLLPGPKGRSHPAPRAERWPGLFHPFCALLQCNYSYTNCNYTCTKQCYSCYYTVIACCYSLLHCFTCKAKHLLCNNGCNIA